MLPRLLIVDGSSLLHESYYGTLPEQMKREKDRSKWHLWYHEMMRTKTGIPTNGIYTAMNRIEKIMKEQNFTHIAIAYDITDDTFRKKMYPDYKGKREAPDESFKIQKDLFLKLIYNLGYPVFYSNDYEADDCIGSLVNKFKNQIPIVILSGDKDMTQLVDDNVQLWFSCKKANQAEELFEDLTQGESDLTLSQYHLPDKIFPISKDTVKFFMGVNADQVVDLKAVSGDSSDNYTGIQGIGEKGAIALLSYFGSLDNILSFIKSDNFTDKSKLSEIKKDFQEKTGTRLPVSKLSAPEIFEQAAFSRRLSKIVTNLSFDITLDNLKYSINLEARKNWYEYLEFYSLLHKNS